MCPGHDQQDGRAVLGVVMELQSTERELSMFECFVRIVHFQQRSSDTRLRASDAPMMYCI
jgi:hypothetical protein